MLFYDGEYFKVGEGRAAITEDKVSDDDARLRTMAAIAMELGDAGIHKEEVLCRPVTMPVSTGAILPMAVTCAPIQKGMSSLPGR